MRQISPLIVATCVFSLYSAAGAAAVTDPVAAPAPQSATQPASPLAVQAAVQPAIQPAAPATSLARAQALLLGTAENAPETALLPEAGRAEMPDEDATILTMDEVDVWGRIRAGYGIPDLDNELVQRQLSWYSARPDYIQRTTKRASRYLFHVVQELEKRNMPTELALLPFIESAFNPTAFSSAAAVGLWQFMPATGRDYQLKQTMFKDERRSVLASTDAALTHLQRLHRMFGDWQLALAAYNWGEGNVGRIVKKARLDGRATDYNSLSPYMPAETRNYVPKLQAVKQIITTPDLYRVALPKVDNQPYFVTITKTRDIDVKVAAQLAELPIDEFKALNPQFNRPVITGSSRTQILLPQENAAKFKVNLSNFGERLSSWTTHKITSARVRIETLAKKLGTSAAVIREVNNIPARMRLKAGSTILVPKTAATEHKEIAPEVADSAVIALAPDVPDSRRIQVRAGKRDSVASIAKRYKVTVAQVRAWNKLKGDKLASGQRLTLNVPYKARATRLAKGPAARTVQGKVVRTRYAAKPPARASVRKASATAKKSAKFKTRKS